MRNVIIIAIALMGVPAAAQDEVVRSLPAEQAEKLLKARKVTFKKVEPDAKGIQRYDFKRGGVEIALYLMGGGKEIMLDAVLPALPLESVNQFNAGAKFSRACLRREGTQLVSILETNLDLQGGVTLETIHRLLDTFDIEVKEFQAHAARSFKDEPVVDVVSDLQIEKMLSRLGLKFTKREGKEATIFDYEMLGHKVKLSNVQGKEIFLDAVFGVIPLDKVNRYNLGKKFIRVVNLKAEGEPYTALQAGLDMSGGVTESIVVHFLTSFEVEINDFENFRGKLKKE